MAVLASRWFIVTSYYKANPVPLHNNYERLDEAFSRMVQLKRYHNVTRVTISTVIYDTRDDAGHGRTNH